MKVHTKRVLELLEAQGFLVDEPLVESSEDFPEGSLELYPEDLQDAFQLLESLRRPRGKFQKEQHFLPRAQKILNRLVPHSENPNLNAENIDNPLVKTLYSKESVCLLLPIISMSPFVGLFGTVWGVMTAFQALGTVQQASIAIVAPSISEALIATAMGLFAAIPAVIAYNRFANQVERLLSQYGTFMEEFSNILYRQLYGTARP